ncbi:hypothetical protein B0T24DRAFT_598421 [Lasiosphaeria ovina]|uniref:Uncharacterized protein n=1 Tax=Lasiosphaeria ovina TaxID=92902 RepID=A0AAE0JVJ9_9PEZI|nr:hypothetical protein B0T24DRAFT_598421 [Lasiosphaeria ovina]
MARPASLSPTPNSAFQTPTNKPMVGLCLFAECFRSGHLPDDAHWIYLAARLCVFDQCSRFDVAYLAVTLYHYNTNRWEVDLESMRKGETGYTGVLEKMSSEVPTCGTERLERKLRVDVERLIPIRRETRLKTVMFPYAVAARHGISLGILEIDSRQIPRGFPAIPEKDGLATEKAQAAEDSPPASTAADSLPSYEAATGIRTRVVKGDNMQPFWH